MRVYITSSCMWRKRKAADARLKNKTHTDCYCCQQRLSSVLPRGQSQQTSENYGNNWNSCWYTGGWQGAAPRRCCWFTELSANQSRGVLPLWNSNEAPAVMIAPSGVIPGRERERETERDRDRERERGFLCESWCWVFSTRSRRGELESGSDMKSFVQRPGGRPAAEREGFEFLRSLSLHPHGDLSGTCRGSYPAAAGFQDRQRNWRESQRACLCETLELNNLRLIYQQRDRKSRSSLELLQK